jgi:hypothetical protein
VDASLSGLGGALGNYVYELAITHQPGFCIAHWEAINILVALRVFSGLIKGRSIIVWCDNAGAVAMLNSGRGKDPLLQCIARNLWLEQASLDCEMIFTHIRGSANCVADLLSRWSVTSNPTAKLFQLLNNIPIWCSVSRDLLYLNQNI